MRCKGPRVFGRDKKAKLKKELSALQARHDNTVEAYRSPIIKKMADKNLELDALDDIDDDHCVGRAGCGYDMTQQLAAIPDDGEVYEYECPACGNTGTAHKASAE